MLKSTVVKACWLVSWLPNNCTLPCSRLVIVANKTRFLDKVCTINTYRRVQMKVTYCKWNSPKRKLDRCTQEVIKRCRLSWLTNSTLVYEPKEGGVRDLNQWVQLCSLSPKKLWRSTVTPYWTYRPAQFTAYSQLWTPVCSCCTILLIYCMKMKFLVLEVCWQILFASIYIDLLRNVILPDRQLLSARPRWDF